MKQVICILIFSIASSAFAQNIKPMDNVWGVKATFGKVINYRQKYGSPSNDQYTFYGIGLTRRYHFNDSSRIGLQFDLLLNKHNFYRIDTIFIYYRTYLLDEMPGGGSDKKYVINYKLNRYSISIPLVLTYEGLNTKKIHSRIFAGIKPSLFFATTENFTVVEKSDNTRFQKKNQYFLGLPFVEITDLSLLAGAGIDINAKKYIFNISGQMQWAVYESGPPIARINGDSDWAGDIYIGFNLTVLRKPNKK